MSDNEKVVRIFTLPLQFPCGPQSSCCGPIGQSDEDVKKLSEAIKSLGVRVEVYNLNVVNEDLANQFPNVFNLLGTFGPGIVPILTVGDEVVSMGTPTPEEAVQAVKERL